MCEVTKAQQMLYASAHTSAVTCPRSLVLWRVFRWGLVYYAEGLDLGRTHNICMLTTVVSFGLVPGMQDDGVHRNAPRIR